MPHTTKVEADVLRKVKDLGFPSKHQRYLCQALKGDGYVWLKAADVAKNRYAIVRKATGSEVKAIKALRKQRLLVSTLHMPETNGRGKVATFFRLCLKVDTRPRY